MDWSKAKTILIIALLITCLILGGILLWQKISAQKEDKEAAAAAKEYLESQGVSFNCDIPLTRPSLPVLFVGFYPVYSSQLPQYEDISEYSNVRIEIENILPFMPMLLSAGEEKAQVGTASSAVLKAAADAENPNSLQINSINLIYYINAQDINENSRDTAIPSWKIDTNQGVFYINAFEQ